MLNARNMIKLHFIDSLLNQTDLYDTDIKIYKSFNY